MGVESLNLGEEIQTLKATAAPKTRDSYTALLKLMENQAMELLHSLPATNGTPTSSQGLKGGEWRQQQQRAGGGGGMVPVKEGAAE
ncbi:hypothetical protein U1Q18_006953 [Sarracenia purpurea var. burkii]